MAQGSGHAASHQVEGGLELSGGSLHLADSVVVTVRQGDADGVALGRSVVVLIYGFYLKRVLGTGDEIGEGIGVCRYFTDCGCLLGTTAHQAACGCLHLQVAAAYLGLGRCCGFHVVAFVAVFLVLEEG